MAPKRTTAGKKGSGPVSVARNSKKGFYIILGVAAIAGIAVLSYLTAQKPKPIALDPNLPPVTSQGYVMGSPTAPIEIIEFGDFECPGCAQFATLTEPDIRAAYVNTGKARFRFVDLPLTAIHANTLNASTAAACADEQGKFWEMHDLLFATQYEWSAQSTNAPDKYMKQLARRITGLDGAKFDECLDSRRTLAKVQSHLKIATDRGVNGTPTFVIGSNQYGGMAMDAFKVVLDKEIAAADSVAKATRKP